MVFGSFKYFLVHCRCIECCTNKHFKISLWVIDSHLIGRLFHVFNVVQFNIGKNSTLTNSTLNAPHCISNDKQGICSYAGKVSMKSVYIHNVICMGHAREIHFPHQFHQCVSHMIYRNAYPFQMHVPHIWTSRILSCRKARCECAAHSNCERRRKSVTRAQVKWRWEERSHRPVGIRIGNLLSGDTEKEKEGG